MAASLVAAAPAATAASFDEPLGGGGRVWYSDGTDTLCASLSSNSYYDVLSMYAHPVVAGRGPDRSFSLSRGQTECRSLATAYEDTLYRYSGVLGFDPVCRCGHRFGGEFYS
jgi:hypothetical protein